MDQIRETIFAPLLHMLKSQQLSDADLLDLIGGFAGSDPQIAQAMAYHARDFMNESEAEVSYSDIIAEVYRRTFFDPEHSYKYHTEKMMPTHELLHQFVNHMTSENAMEQMQDKKGSFFAPPPGHQ